MTHIHYAVMQVQPQLLDIFTFHIWCIFKRSTTHSAWNLFYFCSYSIKKVSLRLKFFFYVNGHGILNI